jgi:hypothetical protein
VASQNLFSIVSLLSQTDIKSQWTDATVAMLVSALIPAAAAKTGLKIRAYLRLGQGLSPRRSLAALET